MRKHGLTVIDGPSDKSLLGLVADGLSRTQPAGLPAYEATAFSIVAHSDTGSVDGALIGETLWSWLYVKLLWVAEDMRGQGLGRQLLELAEEKAKLKGCSHAWVHTFSFQAPSFYAAAGYLRFGQLEDFPQGHQRLFFWKPLNPPAAKGDPEMP